MKTRHLMNRIIPLALGLVFSTGALAQDPVFAKRGSWVSPPNARLAGQVVLSVKEGFAYMGDGGSEFTVIDVRDPDQPAAVGSYTADDRIRALAISGDHAYLAAGAAGLLIVEISNRTSPGLVGIVEVDALAVEISGDWAFVATGGDELLAVDIRDPADISWMTLSRFQGRSGKPPQISLSEGHAYVCSGPHINVIDIRNLADHEESPRLVGSWWGDSELFDDSPGIIRDMAIIHDTLFAAGGEGGVLVLDISDPAKPTFQQELFGWLDDAFRVARVGDHLFVIDDEEGMLVVDLSDPDGWRRTGSILKGAIEVAADGTFAYAIVIAEESDDLSTPWWSLQVVDFSAWANPQSIGSVAFDGFFREVEASGKYAYLVEDYHGLQIIDVSDPFAPRPAGNIEINGIEKIAVSGTFAYVAAGEQGLHVVDVANPDNPLRVGTFHHSGEARLVALSGKHVVMLSRPLLDRGDENLLGFLEVIDVTDPAHPRFVGSLDVADLGSGGRAVGLVIDGEQAYLADGPNGVLHVIDLSIPTTPTLRTTYESGRAVADLAVSGGHAYLFSDSLVVLDVRNPETLVPVGKLELEDSTFSGPEFAYERSRSVVLAGSYAYLAGRMQGARVVDVSNPADPRLVTENPFILGRLAVWEDKLYAAPGVPSAGRVFEFPGFIVASQYRPPRLEELRIRPSEEISLQVSGPPLVPARLQRSTDLQSWEDWLPLEFGVVPLEIRDSETGRDRASFYRLLVP